MVDEVGDLEKLVRKRCNGYMRLSPREMQASLGWFSVGRPTYCATKAAIHSYTLSLRWQLKRTSTEVIELIPPYVQTHLMGPKQAEDPRPMPLADCIGHFII